MTLAVSFSATLTRLMMDSDREFAESFAVVVADDLLDKVYSAPNALDGLDWMARDQLIVYKSWKVFAQAELLGSFLRELTKFWKENPAESNQLRDESKDRIARSLLDFQRIVDLITRAENAAEIPHIDRLTPKPPYDEFVRTWKATPTRADWSPRLVVKASI